MNKKIAVRLLRLAKELVSDGMERKAVRPPVGPYATLIFEKHRVLFTMLPDGSQDVRTGSEPYRKDPEAAIARVFKLFKMNGIKGSDVEVLA